ncbi:low temperature requirement protein A [Actinophytocola sp.]|uniref:low temperature requirement protein A n=1 Tax=Actinophytocola sp. TaxID=1872138 RepID=UPI002D7FE04D|nr:low temperature requirement protein A [Actinophytocola sp.]HET9139085.1 low temperature requirement protein A [Actinophytocola sp.]
MSRQVRARVEVVRESASATTLELFFDLVFVFALTQVTAFMAEDLTGRGLLRGALILAVVWWCWVGYSWLSNVVKADEGVARLAMFVAMLAMFVIALTIPEAFDDAPGGLSGPTVFAIGYLVLRTVHVVLFLMVSGSDGALRRQVLRFTPTMIGGTVLLLIAGQTSGTTQTLLWVAAVAADYGGTAVIGARGWRLNSAKHFAERHGLIIIVALGESIVAIGVGVAQLPITWPIIVAAALGLSVSASLWWFYFDTAALLAERALSRARGQHRVAMARAAFTYTHLPMVVGVVLLALGLKKVLEYAGEKGHRLADPLYGLPLWAAYGGVAMFLLGQVAFAWRCYRGLKVQRLVLAGVLVAIVPLVAGLPALASLGVLAALLIALNVFESVRFAEARSEIRHAEHDDPELLHVDHSADQT